MAIRMRTQRMLLASACSVSSLLLAAAMAANVLPAQATSVGAIGSAAVTTSRSASRLGVTAGDRSILLTWRILAGATAYRVSIRTQRLHSAKWASWRRVKTLPKTAASYQIVQLMNGTKYQVRLEAKHGKTWRVLARSVASPTKSAAPPDPQLNPNPPGTNGWAQVSTGWDNTCGVTTAGAAFCWGAGGSGRLGNGATSNSLVPVPVSGLSSGVVSISTSSTNSCVVTSLGAAKCWGQNNDGQLGNSNATPGYSAIPVSVSGLSSGVASISVANRHVCAVTTTGAAKCWGYGFYGALGNGSTSGSGVPVPVAGMNSGVASISAGQWHSCAVLTSGAAKCWGDNSGGAIGDGSTAQRNTPVAVSGMNSPVASISAGWGQTCSVSTSGGAKCWGYNTYGDLGNGNEVNATAPVDVTGLTSGVSRVSTGVEHSCAVTTSGGIKCWGRNRYGGFGTGDTTNSDVPVNALGVSSGVAAISSADQYSCARFSSGAAKCSGNNPWGQFGNGTALNSTTFVAVNAPS